MRTKNSKTIFVGLSGGVDSSVAALLLKNKGYEVIGVFIKVWNPEFLDCDWEEERLDAMRVAAILDIQFLTCDAEAAYKKKVAEYLIESYAKGHTPNPDVMCNKHIKFGEFFNFAQAHGADGIATGHYARLIKNKSSLKLARGIDRNKDQSYFLWSVENKILRQTYFPIGNLEKTAVRSIAKTNDLPVAEKKDSQGICFLGHVDIKEFLSHYLTLCPGPVLDSKGKKIGTHDGSEIYTIGQRHGFTADNQTIHSRPHYVVGKDLEQNTITVSYEKPILVGKTLILTDINFIDEMPDRDTNIEIQTRYRQRPTAATFVSRSHTTAALKLEEKTEYPAIGQSCVLYKGEHCLGGGIIDRVD